MSRGRGVSPAVPYLLGPDSKLRRSVGRNKFGPHPHRTRKKRACPLISTSTAGRSASTSSRTRRCSGALRDELKLTGTKYGCGQALCGACTVHADGSPIRSCQTSVADGRRTIASRSLSERRRSRVASGPAARPVDEADADQGAPPLVEGGETRFLPEGRDAGLPAVNSIPLSAEGRGRRRAPPRSAAAGSRRRRMRSAPARTHPSIARPREIIGVTSGRLNAHASLPLPSRARRPSLRAPSRRLPLRSQAQPPNITLSVSAGSLGRSSRIRSSRPRSCDIGQAIQTGMTSVPRRVFCMAQRYIFGGDRQSPRMPAPGPKI